MALISCNASPFAILDHPIAGTVCGVTGLIGAVATAPLCFGLLTIPLSLSSVVPFLLPAFVLACCIFAVGATMVGYHLFSKQPSQTDQSGSNPPQATNPNPAPSQPPPPQPSVPVPPQPSVPVPPQPSVPVPPDFTPELFPSMPPTLEYPTPADYPPFTPLMPPLLTHSPTGWLRGAYARAADWQKAHFRIKLPNGQYKDVFVIIPRANDLLAGPGNSDGTHKDWDLITEAANPDLGDGGGTAGITYGHYGENGWTETPTFKKFRAYQQTRRRYFQEHAADFETRGFTIPAHFRTLQIDCGEVLTNEGADHGKDNGFQALAHVLGPNSEANMHKLKIGYATLAKEAVRINAYSIYITGVSEAIYARDPVQCAGIAVPEFLDAYMAALQNAKPGTVDSSPVYCVFGRYANDRSYADPDDPETWTAGDAAYRDNLRIWRDTHPEFALP